MPIRCILEVLCLNLDGNRT